jgi:hypothetical protein
MLLRVRNGCGNRLLSIEELPVCFDFGVDLCYYVYLDGDFVVSLSLHRR